MSAGASCCRAMLTTGRAVSNKAGTSLCHTRSYGSLCRNNTWCRRWCSISQKYLFTSTTIFTPILSPIISKERQHYKETLTEEDMKGIKKEQESINSKITKDSKKPAKENSFPVTSSNVVVEYQRGLPKITVPLPSRTEKFMFTLRPITQTVGDFFIMIQKEDPTINKISITTKGGVKLAATNRIETLLMDDFNLVINEKVYPVSPPPYIEKSKENLRQLQDLQALISSLYGTFNAREYHAELEHQIMTQLEEIKIELEPMEQLRIEIEATAARKSQWVSYTMLILMSAQFGSLARFTWWEYSWDIMEPVTYFATYALGLGAYAYFIVTNQEYMLPQVVNRTHLISLHRRARKLGFDLERYNRLKEEAYELETMLKIIRGPLHTHQTLVEKKRLERTRRYQSSNSTSSSSSSSSRSPSCSPSPDRNSRGRRQENYEKVNSAMKKAPNSSAVIRK